ncbi:MAG: hypothetical protein HOV87_13215 [Catenulispora sp.]|nr:hypothetical protein [Catenulispora sp.]
MEAGDLHDPGYLLGQELDNGSEPFVPEQALDEMRKAVERLRRQLHKGVSGSAAGTSEDRLLAAAEEGEDGG